MDSAFWHSRWENKQIGFHSDSFNVHLEKFWKSLSVAKGATVFVPLCGKTLDMLWLLKEGYKVIGVELSEIAIQDFFSENNLDYKTYDEGAFRYYSSGDLTILHGNFFDISEQEIGQCTACYDRASLIALPREMRQRYVDKLKKFHKMASQQLLVTLEYDQSIKNGPPFSVSIDDVHALYTDTHTIKLSYETEIIDEMIGFQKAGVTSITERVFTIT
ncbi:MAG: Thiopurine S-methyltransferase (EC [uncultured Thiotrichaceae bacterium]|uniref:Thiopurine S-methyltransferase n=1 Tax=uncultured Thiotrichaceae bacterium TaxID=298394 RepID=A0A6S6SFN7_9GAMM|nr:MAG: Thiopurine S-methyltransferase (EC [uncultured Thiotrichaceae bacterium]